MSDKQKQIKKIFSAPCKKITSPGSQNVAQEKLKDSTQIKAKKEKKNDDTSHKNTKSDGQGVKKQRTKSLSKSLSDEEYADLFRSVLERVVKNDDSVLDEDLQIVQQNSCKTPSPNAKNNEDEIDVIARDIQIDKWNERCDDINQENKLQTIEKNKEERQILTGLPKNPRKSRKKYETDETTELIQTGSTQKNDQMEWNEDSEIEEESGTWIQCSNSDCGKWRYVADIPDPSGVPDYWDCSMNSDRSHNTCNDPEEEYDESDHILTKFTLGSVVWAKMDGFPWWPAMIDIDPDNDSYFELPTLTSMVPYLYHVTFFDERVSRAWIKSHFVVPFHLKSSPNNNFSSKSQSHRKEIEEATRNAEKALQLSLKERLDYYSFSERYSKAKQPRGKIARKLGKKENALKDCFAKGEEKTLESKEILSTSNMIRELDMAIEDCNNSEDEDNLNEEERVDGDKSISFDNSEEIVHDGPNAIITNKESKVLIHAEIKSEEESNEDKIEPDYALCENNTSLNNHQALSSEFIHNDDGMNKALSKGGNKISKKRVSKNKSNSGRVKNELKCENEGKIKKKSKPKDNLSTNSEERLPNDDLLILDNERKDIIKDVTQTNMKEVDPFMTEFDSEKENKDPKHLRNEKLSLQSRKKIIEKQVIKSVNEKQKKSSVESKGNRKRSASDPEGPKKIKKERKNVLCTGKKNIKKDSHCLIFEESNKDCGETNKENHDMMITEKNSQIVKEDGVINQIDEGEKILTCTKNLQKVTPTKKSSQSVGSKAVVISCDGEFDEKQIKPDISNRKESKKSKGFINPLKNECMFKSTDQNVPTNTNEEMSTSFRNNSHQDQFVPDVTSIFIADDTNCKAENNKDLELEENCSEDLNLSIDSLEANSLVRNDNEKGNSQGERNIFGRFGGHCIDNGSESDPFELVEE